MNKKLLVIGSSNIDHIIHLKDFPKPGETLKAKNYQIAFGGKGANQAVAAAKLGADVSFMSCLGSDALGTELYDNLRHLGINTNAMTLCDNKNTGIAMIWLSEGGENSIAIVAGANEKLNSDYIINKEQFIKTTDAILIQLETPIDGVETAIDIAYQNNKLVILNPAPAQLLKDTLLEKVHIITPNETEAESLTGIKVIDNQSAQLAANKLHSKGIPQVFITRGESGVFYSHNGQGDNHPGYQVIAVDTTAAGDTFNGGLVAAMLEEMPIEKAIQFAQAASALSVQTVGAQPSIPTHHAVEQFITQIEK